MIQKVKFNGETDETEPGVLCGCCCSQSDKKAVQLPTYVNK